MENPINGELVLFTENQRLNNTIRALAAHGRLRWIAEGIYTTNFVDDAEAILQRNMEVIARYDRFLNAM